MLISLLDQPEELPRVGGKAFFYPHKHCKFPKLLLIGYDIQFHLDPIVFLLVVDRPK